MTSDKGKNIENYVIQHRLFEHSDRSEFYAAKHKILKKTFTLRKIKVQGSLKCLTSPSRQPLSPAQALLQQVNAEASFLKHLKGVGAPRCHKLIKTSHHLYMVYDEFPQFTLRQYLAKTILTKRQKLELMVGIAKTLRTIHKAGVLVIGIDSQNIRVHGNGSIIFTNLALGCLKNQAGRVDGDKLVDCIKENFPRQLVEEGSFGYFTDSFMLGRVFEEMMSKENNDPNEKYTKIKKIVEGMIKSKPQDRYSLEETIMDLQIQKNNSSSSNQQRVESYYEPSSALLAPPSLHNDLNTWKNSMDQSHKEREVHVTPKFNLTIKKIDSLKPQARSPIPIKKMSSLASTSTKGAHTNFNSPTTLGMKTLSIGITPTDRSRSVRSANSPKNVQISRKVNKQRNLAFFLLGLSEFAVEQWVRPELAYLLLKYSNLTLGEALSKLDEAKDDSPDYKQLSEMIVAQRSSISESQSKMRQILSKQSLQPCFRRQLEEPTRISDRYLQSKIVQFAKQIHSEFDKPTSLKRTVQESTGILFKVYMVMKKIEMGSYQLFWDKVYNPSYAGLGAQRYMQEERQLGYRYLKSKVATLLATL